MARPGDFVRLDAGLYQGRETLIVASGVTLEGCQQAILRYHGEDAAIQATGGEDIALVGLVVEVEASRLSVPPPKILEGQSFGGSIAMSYTPPGLTRNGVAAIAMRHVTRGRIVGCNIRIDRTDGAGLLVKSCEQVELADNRVRGGAIGIRLFGSQGLVVRNSCTASASAGMELHDGHDPSGPVAKATLRENDCSGNGDVGIRIISAWAELIADNRCNSNSVRGILLIRCERSMNVAPRATLTNNECNDNGEIGILLIGCEETTVEGNRVAGQGLCGIQLQNDARAHALTAQADIVNNVCEGHQIGIRLLSGRSDRIEGNRCTGSQYGGIVLIEHSEGGQLPSHATIRGNHVSGSREGSGIIVFSSICPEISDNDCLDNNDHGIALDRSPDRPDLPARANILSNRCIGNRRAGILLLGAQSGGISANTVADNMSHGIAIEGKVDAETAPSLGPISHNICERNQECGILLLSAQAERIDNNRCIENGNHGIDLEPHPDQPATPSEAIISANHCSDNGRSGIALFSSRSDSVHDNDCAHNKGHGIVLDRAPIAPDEIAIAPLTANRCLANAQSGIVLLASRSPQIAGNQCSDNMTHGIVLEAKPNFPDQASNAIVSDNLCERNGDCGIILFSSVAELIDHNRCTANGHYGINLEPFPQADALPSIAAIASNHCSANGWSGIALLSSRSEGVTDNHCDDNRAHGIVLDRAGATPDLAASAPMTGNQCGGNDRSGIAVVGADGELLANNVASGNQGYGIVLEVKRDARPGEGHAVVADNICEQNGTSGIALLSLHADVLERNRCSKNVEHGILLASLEDFSSTGSQARIEANTCVGNAASGILLRSSQSGRIAGNRCSDNSRFGIALEMEAGPARIPSRAIVTGNQAFRNGGSGIGLISSRSDQIDRNRCWSNQQSGIDLFRGEDTGDISSHAAIIDNWCSRNHLNGIGLHSCEASEIDGNVCSANVFQGIGLFRSEGHPDIPSRADNIARNLCHHNGQGGINLISSDAGEIARNRCWRNGHHGIVMQRATWNMSAPSRAAIVRNSCYDNDKSGITLLSSQAPILSGNQMKGNAVDFQSVIQTGCDEPSSPEEQAGGDPACKELPHWDDLPEHGLSQSDMNLISGFMTPAGCLNCLADLIGQRSRTARPPGDGDVSARHRHYRLHHHGGDYHIDPVPTAGRDALAEVGLSLREMKAGLEGGLRPQPEWFALVSADEAAVERVADIVQQAAGSPARKSRWTRAYPIHALQQFDHGARNLPGGHRPVTGLFEEELLSQRRWVDRAGCIVRLPEVWLLLSLPLVTGLLAPLWLGRQWTVARDWLGASMVNWLTLGAAVLMGMTGLIMLLNLRMPRVLEIRSSPLQWLAMLSNAIFSLAPVKDVWEKLTERFGTPIQAWRQALEDRAWLGWARRRLFRHGGGVYPIAITHLEHWHEEDQRRLALLVAQLPKRVMPCFVMQMDGRVCVEPALLSNSNRGPWAKGFDLLLADDDDKLRLDIEAVRAACKGEGEPALELLGVSGELADRDREELRGSLLDTLWWPVDLLPTFSIGSAPSGKFSVRRPIMIGAHETLGPEFLVYSRFFVAQADRDQWGKDMIEPVFLMARSAPALRLYRTRIDRIPFERVTGRVGKRNAVAQLAAQLWGAEADALEYIASAIGCGIAHHLKLAADALQKDDDLERRIVAERALEAVRFLGEDLQALIKAGAILHGEACLLERWEALDRFFAAQAQEWDRSEATARMYALYLGACGTRQDEAGLRLIEEDLHAVQTLVAGNRDLRTMPASSRRDVALNAFAAELSLLALMDIELARQSITRLRAQHWTQLPPQVSHHFEAIAGNIEAVRASLVKLLLAARDPGELERILIVHRSLPERLLYALGQIAAAATQDRALLAKAGASLATAVRTMNVPLDPGAVKHIEMRDYDELATMDSRDGVIILEWLQRDEAAAQIAKLLSPPPRGQVPIARIIDRELERLLLLAEEVVRNWAK